MARAPAVLLPLAFIRLILHHQMDRAQLKGLGKGQDIGIFSHELFSGVSQRFLDGGPGLKAVSYTHLPNISLTEANWSVMAGRRMLRIPCLRIMDHSEMCIRDRYLTA